MANYNNSNFSSNKLFSSILLMMYLSLGFIPNLEAVDKIAPQWFFLSILNGISLIFIFYYKSYYSKAINFIIRNGLALVYFSFILWGAISYFYSINPTEVLVNITRQVNVFLMFIFISILLHDLRNKHDLISTFLIIFLGIEVYFVLDQLLELINTSGNISNRANLKGVAANPNITAFSIVNKLPFLIYYLITSRKKLLKILLSLILLASLVCITVIQSRASFLAIILVYLSSFLIISYQFKEVGAKKFFSKIIYLITPLILSIVINQFVLADKGADLINRASTIGISNADNSISARLRYYNHVFQQIKTNPFIGVGLGNWKLKSISFESKDMNGYIVPYHAHSDFIQLGAELGIIGFLLYLSIFILTTYYGYKVIRFSRLSSNLRIFIFIALTSLGTYVIDASLNFPIARPQVLTVWATVLSLILIFYKDFKISKGFQTNYKNFKLLSILFFLVSSFAILPSIQITNKVFQSLKGQMILLQDFNSNQYNLNLNRVPNIVPDIPNITVTTIPINSVKARYYVNAKKYNVALKLLDKATEANPYLYYSEILKSQIFQEQGKLDSAKIYARKAFFGLPNNDLHSSRYINLINITKDKMALEEAFETLTYNNKEVNWKNYLIIASNMFEIGNQTLIKRAEKAKNIFPNNKEIIGLYNKILIGQENMNQAIEYSQRGLNFFKSNDFINASKEFENAILKNPYDYAYYENAASANYMIGDLDKALVQIDKVINELNPLNGKCEYIKALIFIKLGDPIGACPLLKISADSGYTSSNPLLNQYCQ